MWLQLSVLVSDHVVAKQVNEIHLYIGIGRKQKGRFCVSCRRELRFSGKSVFRARAGYQSPLVSGGGPPDQKSMLFSEMSLNVVWIDLGLQMAPKIGPNHAKYHLILCSVFDGGFWRSRTSKNMQIASQG